MIGGALHCAAKELRVAARDPWALVMWLLVPLTIGAMVTAISGGNGGSLPTATLFVVDEDQTLVSRLMVGALDQQQIGQFIDARTVERKEGEDLISAGEGSALLLIPVGFADAVLKEQRADLQLLTNPAQRILPGIIEEFLSVATDSVFYLHRIFGEELAVINDQIDAAPDGDNRLFEDALITELSVSINDAVVSIAGYLDPVALDMASSAETQATGPNYALVFFPGIIFMALLFASQGLSRSFWREREDGTLRRMMIAPLTLGEIFLGKILAGAVLLFVLTAAMASIGFLYHGISPAHWIPAVLWLTLSGLVLFGLMALLQIMAPSQKSAAVVTNIAVYPLMMAGGSLFPFEVMPDWLVAIGRWAPNGFLLQRFKAYLLYDGGLAVLASGALIALTMAAALWMLSAMRLRTFAGVAE